MSYSNGTITGTVCHIGETKEYGQNGFTKRQVVISQDRGKFENFVSCDFIQDLCEHADGFKLGVEVTLEFKLSGRKWRNPETDEVKYFTNVEVTDIVNYEGDLSSDPIDEPKEKDEPGEDIPF